MRSLLLAGIAAVGLTVGVAGSALAATPASTSAASASSAAPSAHLAPNTDCTVKVIGSGVNLHTQPTTSSTIVAQLQYGQIYTSPGCTIVYGGSYGPVCGQSISFTQWWPINYNGVVRYFAAACGDFVDYV